MKTWRWVLILFCAAVAGTALSVYLLKKQPEQNVAAVYSGGGLYCLIDLNNPEHLREYTITSNGGYNTVTADENGIKVMSASCRDGLCLRQGYLSAVPIVCLPNKLVIKWQNAQDMHYDAIAR